MFSHMILQAYQVLSRTLGPGLLSLGTTSECSICWLLYALANACIPRSIWSSSSPSTPRYLPQTHRTRCHPRWVRVSHPSTLGQLHLARIPGCPAVLIQSVSRGPRQHLAARRHQSPRGMVPRMTQSTGCRLLSGLSWRFRASSWSYIGWKRHLRSCCQGFGWRSPKWPHSHVAWGCQVGRQSRVDSWRNDRLLSLVSKWLHQRFLYLSV